MDDKAKFPMIAAIALASLLLFVASVVWWHRPEEPNRSSGPIIFQGEWITRADTGARVCQIAHDIIRAMVFDEGTCRHWQGEPIRNGQTFPSDENGWVRNSGSYWQIHTERGWVP